MAGGFKARNALAVAGGGDGAGMGDRIGLGFYNLVHPRRDNYLFGAYISGRSGGIGGNVVRRNGTLGFLGAWLPPK